MSMTMSTHRGDFADSPHACAARAAGACRPPPRAILAQRRPPMATRSLTKPHRCSPETKVVIMVTAMVFLGLLLWIRSSCQDQARLHKIAAAGQQPRADGHRCYRYKRGYCRSSRTPSPTVMNKVHALATQTHAVRSASSMSAVAQCFFLDRP